ncbi:interferon-inducible GTPase 5-like [Misgurnus anguillicaudatus]|uniref:interferon-inducible GTPase 5-like n=1 Tax=Misgurnus anguillicaudatus TaxID=75329 RepID=UPI003CCF6AFA
MDTCDDIIKITEQMQKEIKETSTQHLSSAENTTEPLEDTFDIITPEEIEDIKEAISTQDLPTTIKVINNVLEQQGRVELNIAVTGESGSGKSTFVNAFRGLGDEEEGAALTGVVETTIVPKVFPHPKYKNVKIWDLPGIGTPNFKASEYLEQFPFKCYDFFIIIASDRFKECHTKLAREIIKIEKKFYFVRSKIDCSITAEKRKMNFDQNKTLNVIRKECERELTKIGIEAPVVFLLSSWDLGKYDLNLLQERMEKDLSKHKRHVLMLAIPNITMEINEKKRKALEEQIHKVAMLSACVAAVPLPGLSFAVDLSIVGNEIEKYYSAIGLDNSSLQMICEKSGKTIEELKSVMKSPLHCGINSTTILNLLGTASLYVTANAVEYVCSLIPVLGSVAAGGISYLTVKRMLINALDELAEDARNVLLAALETKEM